MTKAAQFKARASAILQKHYASILGNRQLTEKEISLEIANLKRREAKGVLHDDQERLYSAIFK